MKLRRSETEREFQQSKLIETEKHSDKYGGRETKMLREDCTATTQIMKIVSKSFTSIPSEPLGRREVQIISQQNTDFINRLWNMERRTECTFTHFIIKSYTYQQSKIVYCYAHDEIQIL